MLWPSVSSPFYFLLFHLGLWNAVELPLPITTTGKNCTPTIKHLFLNFSLAATFNNISSEYKKMLQTENFLAYAIFFFFLVSALWFRCHILTSPSSKGQCNSAILFHLGLFPISHKPKFVSIFPVPFWARLLPWALSENNFATISHRSNHSSLSHVCFLHVDYSFPPNTPANTWWLHIYVPVFCKV